MAAEILYRSYWIRVSAHRGAYTTPFDSILSFIGQKSMELN